MAFKIENGVPLTAKKRGGRKAGASKFLALEVGDSYVYMGKNRTSVANAPRIAFKKAGIPAKFTQRQQPDGTIRIWRIA